MTVAEVEEAVEEIRRKADDDPTPHMLEDALYLNVLRAIANESSDEWAAAMAEMATRTQEVRMSRWY